MKLDKEACLMLENFQLKRNMLEAQLAALGKAHGDYVSHLSQTLDVDLNQYHLDINTGELTKKDEL